MDIGNIVFAATPVFSIPMMIVGVLYLIAMVLGTSK